MEIEKDFTKGKIMFVTHKENKPTVEITLEEDRETMETERLDFVFTVEDNEPAYKESLSFADKENAALIKSYGNDNYNQNKYFEDLTVFPLNYLKKNKITSKFR